METSGARARREWGAAGVFAAWAALFITFKVDASPLAGALSSAGVEGGVPRWGEVLVVAAIACWNPLIAAGLCAWYLPFGNVSGLAMSSGLAMGVPARSFAVFAFARLLPRRALSMAPSMSKEDWCRRLGDRAAIEGWRGGFIAWRRDRAAVGAGVAPVATFWFWAGRLSACLVWTTAAFAAALIPRLALQKFVEPSVWVRAILLVVVVGAAWWVPQVLSRAGRRRLVMRLRR